MMTYNAPNQNRTGDKIIGIGLSKTGTSSLVNALQMLGIDAVHFPSDPLTLQELQSGQYSLSVIKNHQAIAEGIAPFFPQLDKCFPNSKFILTIRDVESWLDSAERHWPFVEQWATRNQDFDRAWEFFSACTFGLRAFDRERFAYVYRTHLKNVTSYFAKRPDDLLVLDICSGEGWEKLCPFLEVPPPNVPFPVANQRQNKDERREWVAKLDIFIQRVSTLALDNDKRPFVLVDDNRMCGSRLYTDLGAISFLTRDREYWGAPADSANAWQELTHQRDQGARMLVFCWDSYWWFEHYKQFTDKIRSTYTCLADDELVRAFDITATL